MNAYTVYLFDENEDVKVVYPEPAPIKITFNQENYSISAIAPESCKLQVATRSGYSYRPQEWMEYSGDELEMTPAIYFMGVTPGDNKFMVKVAWWGDICLCTPQEYYASVGALTKGIYTLAIEAYDKLPWLSELYIDGVVVSVRPKSKAIKHDVLGTVTSDYISRKLESIKTTFDMEEKELYRSRLLEHARGQTEKEFMVYESSGELHGQEIWRLDVGDEIEFEVRWDEVLPDDTETYHNCKIVWREESYKSASMVCSKE